MDNEIYEGDPESLQEQQDLAILEENPEAVISDPMADPSGMAGPGTNAGTAGTNDPEAISGLSKEQQNVLVALVEKYEQDEEEYRERMLPEWKLLEHFWEGQAHNVWDRVAQDWRPIADFSGEDDLDLEGFDPKSVNIYRGHGESIIAALSAGVPATRFFPDDADNIDDVSTSKVYSRAAELIQRRNKATLLLIRALFILWNQGVVAAYNYSRKDPKLGTVVQPIMGMVPNIQPSAVCPECGYDAPMGEAISCEACGYQGPPQVEQSEQMVEAQIGEEEIQRITEDIKLYSPLYFQVPRWVSTQEETPYISLKTDQSPGAVIAAFGSTDEVREKIYPTKDDQKHERWARQSDSYDLELITVRQYWLRSWALEEIDDDAHRDAIKAKFPNGCYLIMAGDEFLGAVDENLDDHWTISVSPVSSKIYARALGWSVKDIQEMTDELLTMVLDNIEHGTPITFADSTLLNMAKFKNSKAVPGMVYGVSLQPGQKVNDFIYETRPATLSDETREFQNSLREYGQFSSGAFPSIYGGQIQGGSNTAREYVESRQQALQRLQITWKILNEWWTEMIAKSTKDYLNNLTYDERFVKPQGKSSYINVWIRKNEMTGRIGEVVAESSEKFPVTWIQKQDVLMNLLQLKDPNILATIFHPENTDNVASLLGFSEFYIPGEDDRSKQLNEIQDLLMGEPMPQMGPMGISIQSTVPVDPEVDDHAIHKQTIKAFLVSDTGQQLKKENPFAYQNCLAHYAEHEMAEQQQMMKEAMKAAMMAGPGAGQSEAPGDESQPNVEAPQEAASA